jgi:hypothetical protein
LTPKKLADKRVLADKAVADKAESTVFKKMVLIVFFAS